MRIDELRSDLEFCRGEIDQAVADIESANRRIDYYRRAIERIKDLIARDGK